MFIAVSLLVSPDVADLNAAALLADSLNANSLAVDSARAIHACLWRAASNFYENKDIFNAGLIFLSFFFTFLLKLALTSTYISR